MVHEKIAQVLPEPVTQLLVPFEHILMPDFDHEDGSRYYYTVSSDAIVKCTIDNVIGYLVCVYVSAQKDVTLRVVYPDGEVINYCIINPLTLDVFEVYTK